MKNKKLLWLTAFTPVVLLALFYMTNTDFALNLNKVSEMLKSGNTSSLQMFYYDGGSFGWLTSVVITIYSTIVPIYTKGTVLSASQSFFGVFQGTIYVYLGVAVGVLYAFIMGYSLARIFAFKFDKFKWTLAVLAVISVILLPINPIMISIPFIIGLLAGNIRIYALSLILGSMGSVFLLILK